MKKNSAISRRNFFTKTPSSILGLSLYGTASTLKTNSIQKTIQESKPNELVSNVNDFGAIGDGIKDDTDAIQRAIKEGNGSIWFPRGNYKITRPIEVKLNLINRTSIIGNSGAKIIMYGKGPAFYIIGTHGGTAGSITNEVWEKQRKPLLSDIEICGRNPNADGIKLELTWIPLLTRLLIRNCRHGIHIVNNNRNLIISECYIYSNRGIGIFYDHVNLHQSIIANSHIGYNGEAGIKIIGSQIFNIQIVGNDIEYNYDQHNRYDETKTSADIMFDASSGVIREGTIVGNTIQSDTSSNGANIRMIGESKEKIYKIGLITISGNHISKQRTNIHLKYCQGIVVSGNAINTGHDHNIHVENSSNIIIGNNVFDRCEVFPRHDYAKSSLDGLLIENSSACIVSDIHLEYVKAKNGAICLRNCSEINMNNVTIMNPEHLGILMDNVRDSRILGCTILDKKKPKTMRETIHITKGEGNMITHNRFDPGTAGSLFIADNSALVDGNLISK